MEDPWPRTFEILVSEGITAKADTPATNNNRTGNDVRLA